MPRLAAKPAAGWFFTPHPGTAIGGGSGGLITTAEKEAEIVWLAVTRKKEASAISSHITMNT